MTRRDAQPERKVFVSGRMSCGPSSRVTQPNRGLGWRREWRGPKGASNHESTPEADTQTIARHDASKEAESPDGYVGYPQMDVVRSDLSPLANAFRSLGRYARAISSAI